MEMAGAIAIRHDTDHPERFWELMLADSAVSTHTFEGTFTAPLTRRQATIHRTPWKPSCGCNERTRIAITPTSRAQVAENLLRRQEF